MDRAERECPLALTTAMWVPPDVSEASRGVEIQGGREPKHMRWNVSAELYSESFIRIDGHIKASSDIDNLVLRY